MEWVLAVLVLLPQQYRPKDKPLAGPAANCGSEISWTGSLEAAQERARETGKPIAWWVPHVKGSPMDRKLVLEKYMLTGPFMMPGVVRLLSEDFIPLRLPAEAARDVDFDLAPRKFVEPGFVFLTPELEVIHKVDRITTFSEAWFTHLLCEVLRKAERPVEPPPPPPDPAKLDGLEGDEALYYHGVALHLAGLDEEGRATWRKIKEGRWAWKAAAELDRDGPFVRGFEVYGPLPPEALEGLPESTTLPREKADPAPGLRFLLRMQRSDGGWNDSNYTFGGLDAMPNVYMAVTALAAQAVRAWDGPAAAIRKAEQYMHDESRIAPEDTDEIVWAHAYRLLYFAESGDKETAAGLVRKLVDLQKPTGAWAHEYANPFVTATVLHALDQARQAGVEVPEGVFDRGADALQGGRAEGGVFTYMFPARKASVQGSAGRMPFCEFTLLLCGRSSPEAVREALVASREHHALLERVRKYDHHADEYINGGFFFWYDQHGRALAARAAGDADTLSWQRGIVAQTCEIDGAWVDSHELGRVYGTAMALLTLKLCDEERR